MSDYIDASFGVDNFNGTKYLSASKTKVNNILMVLFGKPGFYPSIPNLGMNIQKWLYMFFDEIDTNIIKAELINNCSAFLDDVETGGLDVVKTFYNEQPYLLFTMPTQTDDGTSNLILGVSINAVGQLVYNFKYDNTIL
jgi:hypothetical protein